MMGYENIAGWRILGIALLVGCILGWLAFTWLRRRRRREGFQSSAVQVDPEEQAARDLAADLVPIACPPRETDTTRINAAFWKYVGLMRTAQGKMLDEMTVEEQYATTSIDNVVNPSETDTFQVIFPLYLSIYALATYSGVLDKMDDDRSDCARRDLFDRYSELLRGLTTTVYSQTEMAAWNADPKAKSCAALQVIETSFREAKAQLKVRVQDVSGMTYTLSDLRDENLDFQRRFEASCKESLSEPCKKLASQEPVLFPLLAQFEGVAATNYEKEDEINETLTTVGEIYKLLGCRMAVEGSLLAYSADKDAGEIDAETLRGKLETLSPYYLSPDVLKYITSALISPDELQAELMNTSDIFAKINTSMGSIRRISGLETATTATTTTTETTTAGTSRRVATAYI
jgi:hypothetical protein